VTQRQKICSRVFSWIALVAVIQAQVLGLSCASKRSVSRGMSQAEKIVADTLIQSALIPVQNAIVWTIDEKGQTASYWLRGNAVRIEYAGARADLVIPLDGALWKWRETEKLKPLCDCDAWRIDDWQGECPEKEDPASIVEVDMVDLVSSNETALYRPLRAGLESDFQLSELSVEISPAASVGPYLFVKYKEEGDFCRTDRAYLNEGYFVFDLKNGETIEILSDADKEKIKASEQRPASNSAQGKPGSAGDLSGLDLLAVEPRYDAAFNLRVFYMFGAKSAGERADTANQISYSESVSAQGETIPEALAPFAVPPAVVNAFAKGAFGVYPGGWSLVAGSDEQLAHIWTAFSGQ
jgi:hypothetical protein